MAEKRFDTKHEMLNIVQENNQLRFATDDGLFFCECLLVMHCKKRGKNRIRRGKTDFINSVFLRILLACHTLLPFFTYAS